MRLKSALRRGVAAAVIAGIVVSSGIPAYAKTWDIADGDITVKAGETEGTNKVSQGDTIDKPDTDTVITGESNKNTVTIDTSEGDVDVTFDDLKINVSGGNEEDDGSGHGGKAAVTVQGDHDATIELDGDNELKSGSHNAGLEKNDERSEEGETVSGNLTIKDDNDTKGALTAEGGDGGAGIGGGYESGAGNIEITGGTIEAVGGEGAAGIGGGVYGTGHDIEISGGKVSASGGSYSGPEDDPRPGAAGIGDGAGAWSEIDPDAPSSNPNNIIISGDAEVEAKAGASTGGETAAIGGGLVGEIPNDALSNDDHKVTGGSLTRYDPDGKKMEDYSYDRRTPSQPEQPDKPEQPDEPEQPDDTENDDEDDAPSVQAGEVPDRVKQMYEAIGVITHLDGTQELGDVTTAEYDPVNRVLSFDAHGSVFRMTGDSLRELAKEVHELRIRFLDGEGREMEAVIPLARIKDLVGKDGAFELELSQEGINRFHAVGQTGYDKKVFSDDTVLRQNGKELVLVYRVGDKEQKAQETARVEEAIARRKQEKKQWGTVLSGRESSSLSGLPEPTQPGTGTVGGVTDSIADPKVTDMGSITVRLPGKSAPDQTVWKTVTGNIVKFVSGKQDVTHDDSADIVKLVGGKQDSKKDDPASSVGDLSGLATPSPDSLTTAQQPETIGKQPETIGKQPETIGKQPETIGKQPETIGKQPETIGKQPETIGKQPETIGKQPEAIAQQPETIGQQPEVRGWVKDSQGKWIWLSGQESSQQPNWKPNWKPNKWVTLHDYGPWDPFHESAYYDLYYDSAYDSAWMYDYEG